MPSRLLGIVGVAAAVVTVLETDKRSLWGLADSLRDLHPLKSADALGVEA